MNCQEFHTFIIYVYYWEIFMRQENICSGPTVSVLIKPNLISVRMKQNVVLVSDGTN